MALPPSDANAQLLVERDVRRLAPKLAEALQEAVDELWLRHRITIFIYEARRTSELAEMYYKLRRSNARDGFSTWHFYGLAVDVIHPTKFWSAWPTWNNLEKKYEGGDERWWQLVVATMKKHGLDWGGDWTSFKDTPHFQWGTLAPSPNRAPHIFMTKGLNAVWEAAGAV
jgi:peptidoglycan LD-endopeptidase CwlK